MTVDFVEADIFDWDWGATAFDLVAGIFIQFMGAEARAGVFDGMKRAVKPGGIIMIHGYTPKQLDYATGGPKQVENLYTEALLAEAFDGWRCCGSHPTTWSLTKGPGMRGCRPSST